MTALDSLARLLLSNAVAAAALALLVALVTRRLRWAAAVHLLWLAVLLRMVVPHLLAVAVLPAAKTPFGGFVAVTGQLLGPAAGFRPRLLDPHLVLGLAWFAGAVGVVALAVIRTRRLRRLLGRTLPAPTHLTGRVEALARRLGVAPPRTLLVEGRVPPLLWGTTARPRLVLPSALALSLDPRRLDALLAHELAHLVRRDHWVRWLELAVTVVCWWNPVTWWARHHLRRAEERSADAVVSRLLPDHARAYADTLVATLRYLAGTRLPTAVGTVGMADLSEIQRRLEMIMKPASLARPSLLARLALGLALAVSLGLTPLLASPVAPGSHGSLPEVFAEHITLDLAEASLVDVLETFSELVGYDVVVEPGVEGKVTLSLHDVPAAKVLTTVTETHGLSWVFDGEVVKVFRKVEPSASPLVTGTLDGSDVYRFAEDLMTEPEKTAGPFPVYPEEARKEQVSGTVEMDALIDASGHVGDVIVVRSVDNRLSAAAVEAVQQWVFKPATIDGQPVAVRYFLTVRFHLE